MQSISEGSILVGIRYSDRPPQLAGIKLKCCKCRYSVVVPSNLIMGDIQNAIYKGVCPLCDQKYEFFARLKSSFVSNNTVVNVNEMFSYPAISPDREPIVTSDQMKSDKLYRAYTNTVDALNKEAFGSVPAVARRTLEGIVKKQLSEKGIIPRGRMLGDLLTELTNNTDLSESLKELAKVLKDGGNISAHFDEDLDDPTPEMASKSLDLLETIIEYFYVLPAQIDDFKTYLTKSSGNSSEI